MTKPYIDSVQLERAAVKARESVRIVVEATDDAIRYQRAVDYAGERRAGQETGVI